MEKLKKNLVVNGFVDLTEEVLSVQSVFSDTEIRILLNILSDVKDGVFEYTLPKNVIGIEISPDNLFFNKHLVRYADENDWELMELFSCISFSDGCLKICLSKAGLSVFLKTAGELKIIRARIVDFEKSKNVE